MSQYNNFIVTKFTEPNQVMQFLLTEIESDSKINIIDSSISDIEDIYLNDKFVGKDWFGNTAILDRRYSFREMYEEINKGDGEAGYYTQDYVDSIHRKPVFHNIYSWNNSHKLSILNLKWLIDYIPEGETIFINNIDSLFSYYDKGGKRFINFIFMLMNDTKHTYVLNVNSENIREDYSNNIQKYHHNHEFSVRFMRHILNSHVVAAYNLPDDKRMEARMFNNQWDMKSYLTYFYYDSFKRALRQASKIINLTTNMTLDEYMYIYDNKLHHDLTQYGLKGKEVYGFGNINHLALKLGIPTRFLVKMMYYYIHNIEMNADEFFNEQMHVFTTNTESNGDYKRKYGSVRQVGVDNDYMYNEYYMYKKELPANSPIQILIKLRNKEFTTNRPIQNIDLINLNIHAGNVELRKFLYMNVFGYETKIPDHIRILAHASLDTTLQDLYIKQTGVEGINARKIAELDLDAISRVLQAADVVCMYEPYAMHNNTYIDKLAAEYNVPSDEFARQLAVMTA